MPGVGPGGTGVTGDILAQRNSWRGVTLTPGQIAQVARAAARFKGNVWDDETPATDPKLGGGAGKHSKLVIAVAIALAESGGRADAVNRSRYGIAAGVWQIYRHGATRVDTRLFNPLVNAQAAVDKYKAQGWGAWTQFTNGKYRQFLDAAEAGVRSTHDDPWYEDVTEALGKPFEAAGAVFGVLTSASTWIRVGLVLGGAVVLILGILFLYQQAKSTAVGKAVRKIKG